ncbi:predicted protein [Uncinocarpus reesii 1704]|uniref:SB domain-containing protein n=1 Tax=Uncinocarpus reesii (strain UAMH 1704) TaxID=336963 RepID=C4JL17_UNCRE|nr:uncharacterized protein UREG_00232 [Uncinocarpus reesii 1704]EEP75386.1 predicted protein [Uncinocarpus reesii 1704]
MLAEKDECTTITWRIGQRQAIPPAIPPLPPQLARPAPQPEATAQPTQFPPKLPPKPGKPTESQNHPIPPVPGKYSQPPPLPPLADGYHDPRRTPARQPPLPNQRHELNRPSHQTSSSAAFPVSSQLEHGHGPFYRYQQEGVGPVSPITQAGTPHPPISQTSYRPPQFVQPAPLHPPQPHIQAIPHDRHPSHSQHPQQAMLSHPESARRKQPTPDLLTSPFDLELPSQTIIAAPPPIPPNPEKDFLLKTLSQTLTQTLHDNINRTKSGIQPLNSQSQALHAAAATLKSEIASLNTLHTTLQSNTSILQQSLHRADGVIADARARITASPAPPGPSIEQQPAASRSPSGLPSIDEILVPPTVVGKQIYDLVTDERGIERAIYALQTGLVKGRVGLDTWAKLTRSLAREAFLKKVLIRKAGVGMGLSVD